MREDDAACPMIHRMEHSDELACDDVRWLDDELYGRPVATSHTFHADSTEEE